MEAGHKGRHREGEGEEREHEGLVLYTCRVRIAVVLMALYAFNYGVNRLLGIRQITKDRRIAYGMEKGERECG